jgi:hypothetical protein
MNQYQTANQIAEDLRKDPRTVQLDLHRAGIKPDAELVSTELVLRASITVPLPDRHSTRFWMKAPRPVTITRTTPLTVDRL